MAYQTILVYLSSEERANAVAKAAADLAEQHDAHLIGLHIIPRVSSHSVPRFPIPNDMLTKAQAELKKEADNLAKIFSAETTSISGKTEWRVQKARDEDFEDQILENTATVDLVIMSETLGYPFDGVPEMATELVLKSGRPILLIPTDGRFQEIGDRVVVGWQPGREAARAVFDALPLLQAASSVHVVSVRDDDNVDSSLKQICATLQRHGVKASEVKITASNAGKALLAQVETLNADLLVMGGYGRSRYREMIFGGATRRVLKKMTVPVLMSH